MLGFAGFLVQMIFAVQARFVPVAFWLVARLRFGYEDPLPPPAGTTSPALRAVAVAGWNGALALLVFGFARDSALAVGAAGGLWLVAALAHAGDALFAARRIFRAPRRSAGA